MKGLLICKYILFKSKIPKIKILKAIKIEITKFPINGLDFNFIE